ncbi:hypothetical protein C8J56DRAFT_990581 [Mycena floridula]|nr:hypothetical protein C8J56DRAFT_990581 [Mycena floridula]
MVWLVLECIKHSVLVSRSLFCTIVNLVLRFTFLPRRVIQGTNTLFFLRRFVQVSGVRLGPLPSTVILVVTIMSRGPIISVCLLVVLVLLLLTELEPCDHLRRIL